MFSQGNTGGLNGSEKRIVKYLLSEGWTNQDIQALINLERPATINFARIAGVKSDNGQDPASKSEFDRYLKFKRSFDLRTGLNPFVDERLIKSREAMKLAVSVFNNPSLNFRAETFSMLANVAWTYLVLEFSSKNGLPLKRKNGSAISLSDFLKSGSCPFSEGVKNNLQALIKIRDATEHRVLGPYDSSWIGIFQASCVNYEREITRFFGGRLSLSSEISFALQFSGLSIGQAKEMAKSGLPDEVEAINAEIFGKLSEVEKDDLEFQFSVVYMTVESSKSKAAFQFVSPETAEGKEIANVLVKHKPSAITHPYRPSDVCDRVLEKSGKKLSTYQHSVLWKKHSVRPSSDSIMPGKTKLEYCYYNPTFKCYTYNEAWVDFIITELA